MPEKKSRFSGSDKYHSSTLTPDILKSFISGCFVLLGLTIIGLQLVPLLFSYATGQLIQGNTAQKYVPVTQTFLEKLVKDQYFDPGASYFNSLIKEQRNAPIKIDTGYSKPMYITVPKADIKGIMISPNVPSDQKEVYEAALKKGVAHLKGSPLPGAGGTTIIYGHSGIPSLLSRADNPQLIFSRLERVEIGDTFTVEKDGEQITYTITSKKIVVADDHSFLNLETSNEKAILITCWPLGVATNRLVIIGER